MHPTVANKLEEEPNMRRTADAKSHVSTRNSASDEDHGTSDDYEITRLFPSVALIHTRRKCQAENYCPEGAALNENTRLDVFKHYCQQHGKIWTEQSHPDDTI